MKIQNEELSDLFIAVPLAKKIADWYSSNVKQADITVYSREFETTLDNVSILSVTFTTQADEELVEILKQYLKDK